MVHLEKDALKLAAPTPAIPVDMSGALSLEWAWQCRGIAMDQCGRLTWKVHGGYVQRLLNYLTAPAPSSWTPVRSAQLIRADKEVWTLLAREALSLWTFPSGPWFSIKRIQVWLSPVMGSASASSQVLVVGLSPGADGAQASEEED